VERLEATGKRRHIAECHGGVKKIFLHKMIWNRKKCIFAGFLVYTAKE
jgi:hypothetical protein